MNEEGFLNHVFPKKHMNKNICITLVWKTKFNLAAMGVIKHGAYAGDSALRF